MTAKKISARVAGVAAVFALLSALSGCSEAGYETYAENSDYAVRIVGTAAETESRVILHYISGDIEVLAEGLPFVFRGTVTGVSEIETEEKQTGHRQYYTLATVRISKMVEGGETFLKKSGDAFEKGDRIKVIFYYSSRWGYKGMGPTEIVPGREYTVYAGPISEDGAAAPLRGFGDCFGMTGLTMYGGD